MPPDQKASQILSTWDRSWPVSMDEPSRCVVADRESAYCTHRHACLDGRRSCPASLAPGSARREALAVAVLEQPQAVRGANGHSVGQSSG